MRKNNCRPLTRQIKQGKRKRSNAEQPITKFHRSCESKLRLIIYRPHDPKYHVTLIVMHPVSRNFSRQVYLATITRYPFISIVRALRTCGGEEITLETEEWWGIRIVFHRNNYEIKHSQGRAAPLYSYQFNGGAGIVRGSK